MKTPTTKTTQSHAQPPNLFMHLHVIQTFPCFGFCDSAARVAQKGATAIPAAHPCPSAKCHATKQLVCGKPAQLCTRRGTPTRRQAEGRSSHLSLLT